MRQVVSAAVEQASEGVQEDTPVRIAGASSTLSPSLFLQRVVAAEDGRSCDDDASSSIIPSGSEDVELSKDVYATAFILASNATEGMYAFSPLKNRQMRLPGHISPSSLHPRPSS